MITPEFVRTLGNLPVDIKDEVLNPHIQQATWDVEAITGVAFDDSNEKLCAAAGALTMSHAIPVLNTFYLDGVAKVASQTEESDFVFSSPEDSEKTQKYWKDRGMKVLASIDSKDDFYCEVI